MDDDDDDMTTKNTSWLRDDCQDLYQQISSGRGGGGGGGGGTKASSSSTAATCVTKRGRLIRFGLTQSLRVVRRFYGHPQLGHKQLPLFLEFGVHEGKDIARIASFLATNENEKKEKKSTNKKNKQKEKEKKGTDSDNTQQQQQQQQPKDKETTPSQSTTKDEIQETMTIDTTSTTSGIASATQYQEPSPSDEEDIRLRVHGFDSFQGLPEDWHNGQYHDDKDHVNVVVVDDDGTTETTRQCVYKAGTFNVDGQTPQLDKLQSTMSFWRKPSREETEGATTTTTTTTTTAAQANSQSASSLDKYIQFHTGWFDDTVPIFFDRHEHQVPVAFVHADADLYSSTMTFLKTICDYKLFVKGSVIVFDEYWNYPNWQHQGEYQAWAEITTKYNLQYKYIAYHGLSSSSSSSTPPSSKSSPSLDPNGNASTATSSISSSSKKKLNTYGYQSVCIMITKDMD